MSDLRIALAAAAMNLRSLPQRRTSSLVMIISIAGVVAVFSGVLAMGAGLSRSMEGSGRADRVVVLRAGSTAEITSGISREELKVIESTPGIKIGDQRLPLVTGEAASPLTLIERGSGLEVIGTLRGIGPQGFPVRSEIKIIEGRAFEPGKYEVIVGQEARNQFEGLQLGGELKAYRTSWRVVGVFAADRSARESELMTNADTVMGVSQRPEFQNVTAVLESPEALTTFKRVLASNPSLAMDVYTEAEFLRRESRDLNGLLAFLAYVIGGIMALGAIFVALNTIHSSIDNRRREIATLRAIGYTPRVIVASLLAEAVLLAMIGGLIGALIAWSALNGNTISTTVGSDVHQLVFKVAVTLPVVAISVAGAVVIGAIGGFFPAMQSLRSRVVTDLRAI